MVLWLLAACVLASYAWAMLKGWYAPSDVRQSTDELWTLVAIDPDQVTAKMLLAADRGLLSFGGWLGIALLATDGLRSRSDLGTLASWVSWLAALVAALGILQFFTGLDIAGLFKIPGLVANADFGATDSRSVLRRVSSTAIHPIEFGVVMSGIFPIALHRTLWNFRDKMAWVPTVIIGLAIPMSVSRSAVVATGLALIVLWLGWPNTWRLRSLLVAPAAAVAIRILVPGLVGTIASLFTNFFNDPSITGRTEDYSVVFRIYSHDPWLGRGLFTFIPRYYRILDNQFLMCLVELGAIGLAMVTVTFVTGFLTARGARKRSSDPEFRHLCLSVSASLAGVVISYGTFDAWGFPMAAGLTFLLLGVSGAAWRIAQSIDASLPQNLAHRRIQPAPADGSVDRSHNNV